MKRLLYKKYTDGYIYCLFDAKNNICRIGKTDKRAKNRVNSQVGYYPYPLEPLVIYVPDICEAETSLHRKFKSEKLNGDWYTVSKSAFTEAVMLYKKEIKSSTRLPYKVIEEWDYIAKDKGMIRYYGQENRPKNVK